MHEGGEAAVLTVRRKPFIVGVMGSHREESSVRENARRLGDAIARRGHVLLTGGGPGLMRAASEGAHRAGGLVIGILPNDRRRVLAGYPNEFVDIPIYTGMSDARNVINARTPHVLVALPGGVGTLSEIALALRVGTPVIGLRSLQFRLPEDLGLIPVASVEEAIREMDGILATCGDPEAGCAAGVPLI